MNKRILVLLLPVLSVSSQFNVRALHIEEVVESQEVSREQKECARNYHETLCKRMDFLINQCPIIAAKIAENNDSTATFGSRIIEAHMQSDEMLKLQREGLSYFHQLPFDLKNEIESDFIDQKMDLEIGNRSPVIEEAQNECIAILKAIKATIYNVLAKHGYIQTVASAVPVELKQEAESYMQDLENFTDFVLKQSDLILAEYKSSDFSNHKELTQNMQSRLAQILQAPEATQHQMKAIMFTQKLPVNVQMELGHKLAIFMSLVPQRIQSARQEFDEKQSKLSKGELFNLVAEKIFAAQKQVYKDMAVLVHEVLAKHGYLQAA